MNWISLRWSAPARDREADIRRRHAERSTETKRVAPKPSFEARLAAARKGKRA